ncbi:2-keto-4-pentenoate hydratase [Amycolatopsis sp. NPDC059657]|uniref:2-keto-4-pentenoate hydratase n=1 Tax=Amycolatopsis sp. NPDC059657 TaxID=3346899 RepID=UPI00366AC685
MEQLEVVRGYRLTGGSVASRRKLGLTEPAFGTLSADAFHSEGFPVSAGFAKPVADAVIAFVLGSKLAGPGATVVDALRAVDFVVPALEITDSGSASAVVLGATPAQLSTVDLRLAGCVLYHRGAVAATGAGGVVLGSPLNALVWLANQGITLEPGQVVLSGALTPPVEVEPGDSVSASIAGLGSVTATLSGEQP